MSLFNIKIDCDEQPIIKSKKMNQKDFENLLDQLKLKFKGEK